MKALHTLRWRRPPLHGSEDGELDAFGLDSKYGDTMTCAFKASSCFQCTHVCSALSLQPDSTVAVIMDLRSGGYKDGSRSPSLMLCSTVGIDLLIRFCRFRYTDIRHHRAALCNTVNCCPVRGVGDILAAKCGRSSTVVGPGCSTYRSNARAAGTITVPVTNRDSSGRPQHSHKDSSAVLSILAIRLSRLSFRR